MSRYKKSLNLCSQLKSLILNVGSHVVPTPIQDKIEKQLRSDRINKILETVESSDSVLAVGCVRHSIEEGDINDPTTFLFTALNNRANRVVGIDIMEEGVKKLQNYGYEAYVGNAEEMQLNEEFDKIVAGELIEHLENPGLFLESCKEHLRPGGKVVITTPNPRRLQMLLWYIIKKSEPANPEHTMWFDWFVMTELAERTGFCIDSYVTYSPNLAPISNILYSLGLGHNLTAGGWVFVLSENENSSAMEHIE